jgi:hypothetical protein
MKPDRLSVDFVIGHPQAANVSGDFRPSVACSSEIGLDFEGGGFHIVQQGSERQ